MNLARYHFYMKLGALEPEEPFSGKTLPITTKPDLELIEKLIASSRKKYAITYVKKQQIKEALGKPSSQQEPRKDAPKGVIVRGGMPKK